jgi:phage portal protein BeeE
MGAVMREVNADTALTQYKQKYLDHAATPNLLLKYKQKLRDDTIDSVRDRIQARYGGVDNAFKTLILDQGADHAVIGNTLEQMNFTSVQSAGVERICANSGVSRRLLGLPDDSGVTFDQAMRTFADLTMRPLWRSACASLSQLVAVPSNAKLWFDVRDIAALQAAETERAQVTQVHAAAVLTFVQAGMTRDSSIAAAESGDLTKLAPDPRAPVPGTSTRETISEKVGTPPGGPQALLTKPQTQASKVPMPASIPTPALPGSPVSNPASANGKRSG